MGRQLNVGAKSHQGDAHYRWKMEPLETKIEGKGIGRKTVLLNISHVAAQCFTQPQYMTKFFGYEIGAQSKWDDHRKVGFVNGVQSPEELQELVYKYIELLILCPSCNRPELRYLKSGKNIRITCLSCGLGQKFNLDHQISNFIKNSWVEPSSQSESDQQPVKQKRRHRHRKDAPVKEVKEVAKPVEVQKETEVKPVVVDNPVLALKPLLDNKRTKEFGILFEGIQKGHKFDDKKMGSIFMNAVLDFDSEEVFMETIEKHSGFLRWYVSEEKQRDIFMSIFEEMLTYSDYVDSAAHIFAKFHEKIIFHTDYLMAWFEKENANATEIKEYAEPFIEYLRGGTFESFETYFAENYGEESEEEEEN